MECLRTGVYVLKTGQRVVMSPARTFQYVVELIARGVPVSVIPVEVRDRFDWHKVAAEVEEFASEKGVAPELAKAAVGLADPPTIN